MSNRSLTSKLVGFACLLVLSSFPNADAAPVNTTSYLQWPIIEQYVLELTNVERGKQNIRQLESENTLHEIAHAQSADMLDRSFFSHINPSGEDAAARIARKHRRFVGSVGENIWKGTGFSHQDELALATAIVNDWMDSPSHRSNVLNREYTHLGIGIVIRGDEVRATQMFAKVRAYLLSELPDHLAPGSPVGLASMGPAPHAELFDMLDQNGTPIIRPTALKDARGPSRSGRYRVRLYFPGDSNLFMIFQGPEIAVQ